MGTNVIDQLVQDHNQIRELLADHETTPFGEIPELFERFLSKLARHDAAEQRLVYPVVRREVPNGVEEERTLLGEKRHIARRLQRVSGMSPSDPRWDLEFSTMRVALLRELDREEQGLFPRLREVLSETEMQRIGRRFRKAHPLRTRPFPSKLERALGWLLARISVMAGWLLAVLGEDRS